MVRIRLLFVIVSFLLAFSFRNQAPAVPQQDPEALARVFLEELASGKFEQAAGRFDERMAQLMPATKLAEAWQQVISLVGTFREVTGATRSERQGLQIVTLSCRFEGATWDARIVIDAKGRLSGLWFGPAQQPQPPWSPAPSVKQGSFEERDVTVGADPWTLPGKLTMPKGTGTFAAVVLVHGSGPNDEDESIGANKPFKDLAWGFASRRVAVLRYVKRTRKYPQQMMAVATVTVKEETVEDAVRAVELLAKQPGIDPRQIYIAGHSLGAFLAPRIAKASPNVAGIVIMSGSTRPLETLIVEQVEYLANLDGNVTAAEQQGIDAAKKSAREIADPNLQPAQLVGVLGTKVPGSYFLDLRNYQAEQVAASLKIPILILQGERDYQVRMVDFEGWKKALAGQKNAVWKSYPALNHLFMAGSGPGSPAEYAQPGHVADEVIQDIADWILARGKKLLGPQRRQ